MESPMKTSARWSRASAREPKLTSSVTVRVPMTHVSATAAMHYYQSVVQMARRTSTDVRCTRSLVSTVRSKPQRTSRLTQRISQQRISQVETFLRLTRLL